jgi:hypothetical protein
MNHFDISLYMCTHGITYNNDRIIYTTKRLSKEYHIIYNSETIENDLDKREKNNIAFLLMITMI